MGIGCEKNYAAKRKRVNQVRKFLLFLFVFSSFSVFSKDEESYPTFSVDGWLKGKYEYATSADKSRFSVRSSRIGVKGNLTKQFSYRALVELNDNGALKPLDLYAGFNPIEGLTITFGQRTIPLFNAYTVIPADLMFSNRAFLGKYLMATRDIGVLAMYAFNIGTLPASAEFGLYNGNVINDPAWHDTPSYGGRLAFGNMKGFRTTYKFYNHTSQKNPDIHYLTYGADLRYEGDNWKAETEIMKRDDKALDMENLLSYYLQGAYAFPLKEHYIFKSVVPAFRWEGIDLKSDLKGFDVNRLTLGLGFGLTKEHFSSILRFDYEKYLVNNRLGIMSLTPEMDSDKFTVELLLRF